MFTIAYAFKGQVHVFAGQVKIVSHPSCRTSPILKYFVPCLYSSLLLNFHHVNLQHSCYKHVFTCRMGNNADPDQLASDEAS